MIHSKYNVVANVFNVDSIFILRGQERFYTPQIKEKREITKKKQKAIEEQRWWKG